MATDFDSIVRSAAGVEQFEEQQQEGPQTQTFGDGGRSTSIGAALTPVLQIEKSDAMFWMMVVQTFVLIAIWRGL